MRISDWSSDVCSSDLRERTVAAEKPCGGHLALGRNRDLRQHGIDQILLSRAQRLALRSAVEAVEGRRVAGFMRRNGARVSAARRGAPTPPAHVPPRARPRRSPRARVAPPGLSLAWRVGPTGLFAWR